MEAQESIADYLQAELSLVPASTGKRLANFIIDVVFFYIVVFAIMIPVAIVAPEVVSDWANNSNSSLGMVDRLLSLVAYATFMGIIETAFKGKSLGKLITRTRAVNLDGSRISAGTAFARGFSRSVPFCVFSAFGTPCNPWQDRWTNTMVIDEKESELAV